PLASCTTQAATSRSAMTRRTDSARNGLTTRVSCFMSEPSAGDRQSLSGNVAGLFTRQEKDGVGNVFRPADTAHRDLLFIFGEHFGLEPAQHRRLNHARRHGINRDAAPR